MENFNFLAPILRKKQTTIVTFLVTLLCFGIIQMLIPAMSRTIVYFSVKPMAHVENIAVDDPADSAEKVADTIAGWAKDPGFREQILRDGNFYIDNLKQKLTARKQNRMNVFWTTTLYEEEQALENKMAETLVQVLEKNIADYNANNSYPIKIGTPRISHQEYSIPAIWYWIGAIILSLFFAALIPIILETLTQKISNEQQLSTLLSNAPILHISEKLGTHDQQILEQFLGTFDSPRLIGTFKKAEKHFSLAAKDSISETRDTPVLLIKLGETTINEVKNLKAIFDDVAVIVFYK